MVLINVDFPAPFGPMIPVNDPLCTEKLTSCRTVVFRYEAERSFTSKTVSFMLLTPSSTLRKWFSHCVGTFQYMYLLRYLVPPSRPRKVLHQVPRRDLHFSHLPIQLQSLPD